MFRNSSILPPLLGVAAGIVLGVAGFAGLQTALDDDHVGDAASVPPQTIVSRFREAIPAGTILSDETVRTADGIVTTIVARFDDQRVPENLTADLRDKVVGDLSLLGEETSGLGAAGSRVSIVYIADGAPVLAMINVWKLADGHDSRLYLVTLTALY